MTCSPRVLDAVEGALSRIVPRTPAQVNETASDLARTTVRHALRELVKAGRATFTGPECQRRYRRRDPDGLDDARRVHALATASEET